MYKGDTIQELVTAVDAIRERRSGNAVEQVFTNPPHLGSSDHDRTSHLEANLSRISMGRG
jgi:hypothetical protein